MMKHLRLVFALALIASLPAASAIAEEAKAPPKKEKKAPKKDEKKPADPDPDYKPSTASGTF